MSRAMVKFCFAFTVAWWSVSRGAGAFARELSFEQRVAAQTAIEQVYWSHRIWPKENPTPKPPLSAAMPDGVIRAKVEDYLRQSSALEAWWHRPVTAEQLQAEIDRMSKRTRDPDLLRELYAALGNDPFVIAETLARQTLVDRLIHAWYATDDRFHGALRSQVEQALLGSPAVTDMATFGGRYAETIVVRRGKKPVEGSAELGDDDWLLWRSGLARRFGTEADDIPLRRISDVHEDADAFSVCAVLSSRTDRMVVASVAWPKRSFDAWWSQVRARSAATVEPLADDFEATAPAADPCVNDTWELRFYAPSPRAGHTAIWTGTEMIVWGGLDGANTTNTGGRYNPSTDSWTATGTGSGIPAARFVYSAVWTGTEMIVWGGQSDYFSGYLSSGARYNPVTDAWTATSTGFDVPSPRSGHTAVWTGSQMIVWGGSGDSAVNTGGRYDPSTDAWIPTSDGAEVPAPRAGHTAVWTGAEMIVWGGYSTGNYHSTGGLYNPTTDSWKATDNGPDVPAARAYHAAVWTGTAMIVWGGYSPAYLNTGSRYDPATDTWKATSTAAGVPSARYSLTAVWTGSEMIVWGGSNGGYLSTGGRYTPSTDTWVATSTGAGVPVSRRAHTAIWTGTEMIVWGGGGAIDHLNTGARYSPATDSWVPISMGVNVPSARSFHTAVWTGTEMIVWGGYVFGGVPLDTGGRYTLATDTWTATSLGSGLPSARAIQTAVWTGSEMIVWGGDGGARLNTGGRYDPASNTWSATSTAAGVPSARSYHSAVWTGTQMIVWGGSDDTLYFQTGGRYTPSSNSWTATSTGTFVPSIRDTHTAVWTGTQMIVWGGYNGTGDVGTGARYSPATNSWTPTATFNAPAARDSHKAVWTGSQMIVWGGYAAGTTNTGGRYTPASNSWVPTSTALNVPSAREYFTAVWNGAEIVVWGGRPGVFGWFNSGGRYEPSSDNWSSTSTGANVAYPRFYHTAVWTGRQMLVWGGQPSDINLGLYCAAPCQPSTFHRDQDGDGFGNPNVTTQTCSAPAGYVTDGTDCNDGNAAIHPGVTEACNGVDDDCDMAIDEGAAPAGLPSLSASNSVTLDWLAIPGATRYDVLRGTVGVWPVGSVPAFETCLADDVVGTSASDTGTVPENVGYWYLVRAANDCGNGSYGSQGSNGVPTVPRISATCP